MVRALPCHGRGYGFEPRRSRPFFRPFWPILLVLMTASGMSKKKAEFPKVIRVGQTRHDLQNSTRRLRCVPFVAIGAFAGE